MGDMMWHKQTQKRAMQKPTISRVCPACDAAFKTRDKRFIYCAECQDAQAREANKIYYANNRERILARQAAYDAEVKRPRALVRRRQAARERREQASRLSLSDPGASRLTPEAQSGQIKAGQRLYQPRS